MSAVLRHARAAGVARRELPHDWDEWNVLAYYRHIEADLLEQVQGLTGKANLGLTIATAEWLVERFTPCDADPEPPAFLDAAWAGAAHPAYCAYMETDDDDWRGPVRGPMAMAMAIVNDATYGLADHPDVALRACWMHNLLVHVLPDEHTVEAFETWWDACVDRLATHHAIEVELAGQAPDLFDNFPDMGSAVPPSAYDPAQPYDPSQAGRLWDDFLRALDPSANPFLTDPAELAGIADLPGPPYRHRH